MSTATLRRLLDCWHRRSFHRVPERHQWCAGLSCQSLLQLGSGRCLAFSPLAALGALGGPIHSLRAFWRFLGLLGPLRGVFGLDSEVVVEVQFVLLRCWCANLSALQHPV